MGRKVVRQCPNDSTLRSIRACAEDGVLCGCSELDDGRWKLCAYHEGYDDGVSYAGVGDG